jgi:hypothetical protein
MNKRQKRLIAVMKSLKTELFQSYSTGAAWFIWHPTHYNVRMNLTCRDVFQLVCLGMITTSKSLYDKRFLTNQLS